MWSCSERNGITRNASGVCHVPPRGHPLHSFREASPLGQTKLAHADVMAITKELAQEWLTSTYSSLGRNCVDFAVELCRRLGVGPVPEWVLALPRVGARLHRLLQASPWSPSPPMRPSSKPAHTARPAKRGPKTSLFLSRCSGDCVPTPSEEPMDLIESEPVVLDEARFGREVSLFTVI